MDNTDRRERVRELHDHLRATAELPLDPRANRWLGEAEAVARDVAGADMDEETLLRRVRRVRELLAHVDGTGHEAADERVEAARDVADAVLAADEE